MDSQMSTKERYLFEALKLFGEKGFSSVTISEIAKKVGCTTSTLYKHYENKQRLYEAILEESIKGYNNSMEKLKVDFNRHPKYKDKYISMTEEEQFELIRQLFLFLLHDQWVTAFRKLMMVEQFHNKELANMFDEKYIRLQCEQYAEYFRILIDAKKMKPADPYTMAVAYISPIVVMIGMCDRDPGREDWALEMIEKHVREFNRIYRINENEGNS